MMVIEWKELSPIRKSVEIEVPAEEVETHMSAVTGEFARAAKVPGFRRGKVPMSVIRKRFRKEISGEVVDRLLPEHFTTAVKEKGWAPVGPPVVTRLDDLEQGKPFRFEAAFEIKPEVELKDYRGIEVHEPSVEVTDRDVDEIIERYRDRASTFRSVSGRAIREGDYVIIDVVASGENVERRETQDYRFSVGEDAPLPELSEAVVGKNVGDDVTFEKSYDDDAPNEEVRGKRVRYEVKVKDVQELERPDLNDDFAKETQLGETLDAVRDRIRQDLGRHREQEAKQAMRKEAGEKLAEMHALEVPEAMVEDEVGKGLREYARYLTSQGVNLEYANIDWDNLREQFRPEAEKRAIRELVLEAIAAKEGIAATEEEVDAEIRAAANAHQQEFREVKMRLIGDGSYDELRASIAKQKALDFVVEQARKVAAPASEGE